MATLAGQRAQFTWALNQYNLAEDEEHKTHFAKRMARYIAAAPANGFTADEVTQGQIYPVAEVAKHINEPDSNAESEITEGQALKAVAQAVEISNVRRLGEGPGIVYAYGYRCAPDRLKIGLTEGDTLQRIVAQIGTSTPDKPVLLLEIRTHDCRSLERAIHSTLEHRGRKINGGGAEWFTTTCEEVLGIYQFISGKDAKGL